MIEQATQVLTADEAATFLRLSVRALYAAVRRGSVPACRLGERRLRFRLRDLEQVLAPTVERRPGKGGAREDGDADADSDW